MSEKGREGKVGVGIVNVEFARAFRNYCKYFIILFCELTSRDSCRACGKVKHTVSDLENNRSFHDI